MKTIEITMKIVARVDDETAKVCMDSEPDAIEALVSSADAAKLTIKEVPDTTPIDVDWTPREDT